MSPDQRERLVRLMAKLSANLERQQRLMDQAGGVLKQAERRLQPTRTVHA